MPAWRGSVLPEPASSSTMAAESFMFMSYPDGDTHPLDISSPIEGV